MGGMVPDIEESMEMVRGHGDVAQLGYIVKAVLGANWRLSTRQAGRRPAPALLTTLALAQEEDELGPGPRCPVEPLLLQMPKQAATTGRPELLPLPRPELCSRRRGRVWLSPSDLPLIHSPGSPLNLPTSNPLP